MLNPQTFSIRDEVVAACAKFRQGDVISDVHLTYGALFDFAVTAMTREREGVEGEIAVKVKVPFAILTSPTCDIANPHRLKTRPFCTVARVANVIKEFSPGSIGNIRKGKVADLRPLSGTDFNNRDELWVADLRFESAIERSMLVGREPIKAFTDEDGYLRFSNAVGRLKGRVGFDESIVSGLQEPLNLWLQERPKLVEQIAEAWIRCRPSSIAAESLELFFLVEDYADPEQVGSEIRPWVNEYKASGATPSIDVFEVYRLSEFTRGDQIGAELLDLESLS